MKPELIKKLAIVGAIILLIILFKVFGLDQYLTLSYLKEQQPEWFKQALYQARSRGVVNMLAREEEIKVTESEVQDVLNAMATNRGVRPEQIRREAIEKDMLTSLSFRCLQIKTFEHYRSQLKITDMPADEWSAPARSARRPVRTRRQSPEPG